jgi:WD40-like Beta Propeller Repeat
MGRAPGLLAFALLFAGCDSELVTLGRLPRDAPENPPQGMPRYRFAEPVRLSTISSDGKDDNPTLTADLRELYFLSTRDGDADVFVATRASVDEPFGSPVRVDVASSDKDDASPAISLDGQTLWVGQNAGDDDNTDIWFSTRLPDQSWSALQNATSLNSSEKDIPRQPAGTFELTIMPLGSQRNGGEYQTFFAISERGGELGMPAPIPELEIGARVIDGFLTQDLLTLFFSSGSGEDEGDLFLTTRASLDSPFGAPVPLDAGIINTEHDERDPWLSPDGRRLFFTSNRDGNHDIYEAAVSRD